MSTLFYHSRMSSDSAPAFDVFFSYSHRDEKLRDALEIHLALMKREGEIRTWHDRRIGAGTEWQGEIDARLESADLVLLLISPDFIASAYCFDREMTRALERHAAEEARVIPVILRPVDWQTARFAKLQALPTGGEAITTWPDRDSAFVNVVRGIRAAIEDLRERRQVVPAPLAAPNGIRAERANRRWVLAVGAAAVALAIYFIAGRVPPDGGRRTDGRAEPTAAELHRIFTGETSHEEIFGRLALRLVDGSPRGRQVGVGHGFRSDDYFRFEATSSRDGWLYVFHRPPGGKLALLWPERGEPSANAVLAREATVIPPGEDAFLFTGDIGEEYFYVAFIAASAGAKIGDPEERLRRVKGLIGGGDHGSAVAGKRRGVIVARPGEGAHLYFIATGDGVTAAVELRLRHDHPPQE